MAGSVPHHMTIPSCGHGGVGGGEVGRPPSFLDRPTIVAWFRSGNLLKHPTTALPLDPFGASFRRVLQAAAEFRGTPEVARAIAAALRDGWIDELSGRPRKCHVLLDASMMPVPLSTAGLGEPALQHLLEQGDIADVTRDLFCFDDGTCLPIATALEAVFGASVAGRGAKLRLPGSGQPPTDLDVQRLREAAVAEGLSEACCQIQPPPVYVLAGWAIASYAMSDDFYQYQPVGRRHFVLVCAYRPNHPPVDFCWLPSVPRGCGLTTDADTASVVAQISALFQQGRLFRKSENDPRANGPAEGEIGETLPGRVAFAILQPASNLDNWNAEPAVQLWQLSEIAEALNHDDLDRRWRFLSHEGPPPHVLEAGGFAPFACTQCPSAKLDEFAARVLQDPMSLRREACTVDGTPGQPTPPQMAGHAAEGRFARHREEEETATHGGLPERLIEPPPSYAFSFPQPMFPPFVEAGAAEEATNVGSNDAPFSPTMMMIPNAEFLTDDQRAVAEDLVRRGVVPLDQAAMYVACTGGGV